MQPTYSVIVPHFNDCSRLERLLHSVPVERSDIEVIVIDDCSSQKVALEAMQARWVNVQWLSTPENSGAGVARNIGLDAAIGRWLLFADSDDEFLPGAFEVFDESLRQGDQLVYFLADAVYEEDGSPSPRADAINQLVRAFAVNADEVSSERLRLEHVNPVGKIYSRAFVDELSLRFDPVRFSNDIAFNVLAAVQAERVRVEQIPVYLIYRRKGSLTTDTSRAAFLERFLVDRSLAQRLAVLNIRKARSATGHMLLSLRYGPRIVLTVWWLAIRSPMRIEWLRIIDLARWRLFLKQQNSR